MEQFIKQQILDAFKRCFGLKYGVIQGQDLYLESLAFQTGVRLDYIIKHLDEIKEL